MCGIAGVWGENRRSLVREMADQLVHRGPDDFGCLSIDGAGDVAHWRLSIMDPVGGKQPIQHPDEPIAIIANGEIYNYPRLKTNLARRCQFDTESDTESALHLYQEVGVKTAEHLDGMFAIAITDGNELYLARDSIGIKPLYLGKKSGSLVFASELKAFGDDISDVREFPPGSWYHTQQGWHRYYNVPDEQPISKSLNDHLLAIRNTLEASIVKRLMSDVPVGAFLSGGLDSSIIAAIARQHVEELHTFSVGLRGSRDLLAAREVASYLDAIHHEYQIEPEEVIEHLPRIIYFLESFDQDLVRSAIPCYFTSRLASDYVKVILTGEGADELFAGYDYYRNISSQEVLQRELRRSVCSLHNINLQRVDRLTMAHSIEGRVPFLDTQLIEIAQRIPAQWKLYSSSDGEVIEKWILRKAFEDLLPKRIVWRNKEQFDEGSGISDLMPNLSERFMSKGQSSRYMENNVDQQLRSREECVYHKLFCDAFKESAWTQENLVARWAER